MAVAAVIGSVLAIPGIVCGHLALARHRQASPKEKRLALVGLVIGYCVLAAGLAVLAIYVSRTLHQPKLIVRDDPKAVAVTLAPARIVDEVAIADETSETAHQLKGTRTHAGEFDHRHWRGTRRGGSFSYVMKVLPDEPMTLNCTYWGNDTDHREFKILVDDEVIATQKLDFNAPGHFFDVEYRIPSSATHGKSQVTVQFVAVQGNTAGGVFGCQMLRK